MKRMHGTRIGGRSTLGSLLLYATDFGALIWLLAALASSFAIVPSARAAEPHAAGAVYARVNERVITLQEYQGAFTAAVRAKYYHARPPEDELERVRREVGEQLVNRVLLLEEAERRGLAADAARVEAQLAEYERRYAGNEQWRAVRGEALPQLRAHLERESRLERLEAAVRAAGRAAPGEARAYYDANPAPFTEPQQVRVSVILLRVDPSAPQAAWDAARAEAGRLHERLARGAAFAELARLHSADPSAQRGGDLGYLHRGMLPEDIERGVVDRLQPGEHSAPVALLQGIAILRLDERRPERLREFADVAARAEELLWRERGERAWSELKASLRAAAVVQLNGAFNVPPGAK